MNQHHMEDWGNLGQSKESLKKNAGENSFMNQMANAARLASQLVTNPTFATDSPSVTPHNGSTDSAGGQSAMSQTDIMDLLR